MDRGGFSDRVGGRVDKVARVNLITQLNSRIRLKLRKRARPMGGFSRTGEGGL